MLLKTFAAVDRFSAALHSVAINDEIFWGRSCFVWSSWPCWALQCVSFCKWKHYVLQWYNGLENGKYWLMFGFYIHCMRDCLLADCTVSLWRVVIHYVTMGHTGAVQMIKLFICIVYMRWHIQESLNDGSLPSVIYIVVNSSPRTSVFVPNICQAYDCMYRPQVRQPS